MRDSDRDSPDRRRPTINVADTEGASMTETSNHGPTRQDAINRKIGATFDRQELTTLLAQYAEAIRD